MRVKIWPYKMASRSAKALSAGANVQRIKTNGKYRYKEGDIVVNWGNSDYPHNSLRVPARAYINSPGNVNRAANKWNCLATVSQAVQTVGFTTIPTVASEWLADDFAVVERHQLRGHSGAGIVLCEDEFELGRAPLYTKYQKKTHEYRVHVLPCGKVVVNQKRRRKDVPDEAVNWKVRNYDNGFTYCRDNVEHVQKVEDMAKKSIRALGLHFGAVDIIYHKPSDEAYFLEVNTAPGLEGSLVDEYVQSIKTLIKEKSNG